MPAEGPPSMSATPISTRVLRMRSESFLCVRRLVPVRAVGLPELVGVGRWILVLQGEGYLSRRARDLDALDRRLGLGAPRDETPRARRNVLEPERPVGPDLGVERVRHDE